ncbi:hypothetical protein CHLNCDRAFT_54991 [Chlorella variabilis]|uniref:MYND-type domain-containing protein n=1 Tax=Chlorella variabilis TaxID=554065 RepID=E1ZRC9_CHLVA|nr:hypothetical protein CHLNCDRAFT_54991 [Chlorella variabilis]EFN51606.1 hypothetical protein CHLNCDRAFT_54991 [Chlorella variabilis]|eukprot:XP_005843708.1 hypothetical protein CHLNCDRAFT_54991 [Chlorella variabilis]
MALRDEEGLTPRMRAIKHKQPEAAQLLLELERQQAERQQLSVPSSRAPQLEQAEAAVTGPASAAAAEAAAEAAAGQLLAEEEREREQQAVRQAAKAAKRQRQKERRRQRAAVPAGDAGGIAAGQAAGAELTPQQVEAAVEAAARVRVCAAEGCGNTSGLRRCSGCRAVRYCSEACSHAHWKAHKIECRRLHTAAAAAQS